jgi:hypothetical protein
MNVVLLIVSVGVEYPTSASTVGCVGVVGCIPALQGGVLALKLPIISDSGIHV